MSRVEPPNDLQLVKYWVHVIEKGWTTSSTSCRGFQCQLANVNSNTVGQHKENSMDLLNIFMIFSNQYIVAILDMMLR